MRACRSRVTHPSAGRHQDVLLHPMLPLDLHVLSLPLAFILSQDQTLLCIICLFLLADPACSSADRTASRPLGPPEFSCRPGCPSAAFLSLISRTGLQRYCFFLYFQIFSHFFSCFFPAASGSGTARTPASPWTAHGYDNRPEEEKFEKKYCMKRMMSEIRETMSG